MEIEQCRPKSLQLPVVQSEAATCLGKGNDNQPKKGSQVNTKKGKSPSGGARVFSRQDQEKFRLYEDCINAPPRSGSSSPESKDQIREKEILKKGARQAMGVPDTSLAMSTWGSWTSTKSPSAESGLLQLKKEAIEALSEKLRAVALVPNLTLFPKARFMATLMPPIEGYIDEINVAKKGTGKEIANRD
ncbi:hypothetical protein Tsubulata_008668 [Turnera subulata]|uniref:Uncharacterized protein n=1 Tax=Turnera subulata TaxID=218843 RepID=A0A9Q0G3U6_9ROSI|nr:hypothetical protein Tsubulata_008668 [Turnera subulata]